MSVLNTAVSGMLANTNWLTTIAQNVANANTTGYKDVDTAFSALVDTSVNSASQFAGVSSSNLAQNSLQGQIEGTSTTTDLGIQGAGYFVVQNSTGDIYLTRDGSFVPDASGNLVNAEGYYLLGSPVGNSDVALNSLSGLSKVNVTDAGDTTIASTSATLVANLPSSSTPVTGDTPATNAADSSYTSETSLVAYDDLGAPVTVNFYFTNTGSDNWEVTAYNAADAAASGGFPYSSPALSTSTMTFDPTTGSLTSGSPLTFAVPGGQTVTMDLSKTTQLASAFAVSSESINGNAPGTITSVGVSSDGTLSFDYGNGSVTAAYTIPIAKVASPDNLTAGPGNAFQANPESGAPQVGVAGTAGLGTINSSSLEASTVDLATELTNMVQAQSSYEANSKVFQAGAKLLDILNNIQA